MTSVVVKLSLVCSASFLVFISSSVSFAQEPQFACSVDVTHPCSAAGNGGCNLIGDPSWPECSDKITPDPAGTFQSAIFKFQNGNNSISVSPNEVNCGTFVVCRPEDPEFDGVYVCVPTSNSGAFMVTEVIATGDHDCFSEWSWGP